GLISRGGAHQALVVASQADGRGPCAAPRRAWHPFRDPLPHVAHHVERPISRHAAAARSGRDRRAADLGGLAPEPGCQGQLPGKLLCVETTKTNVSPTPPGAPAGPAAGRFVCYKAKCPKGAPPVVTVTDQFGTRTVTPSAAQLLCAPMQVGGPRRPRRRPPARPCPPP